MKELTQVKEIVKLMKSYLDEGKTNKQNQISKIGRLSKEVDVKKLEAKHAKKGFDLMLNAFDKGFVDKALNHSVKVLRQLSPVANDFPFNVNDEVYVIRYEHGWMDGNMKAKIVEKFSRNGIWSYMAKVFHDGQYDDEYVIQIDHTRDAVKV